jgi:hypothetical protein
LTEGVEQGRILTVVRFSDGAEDTVVLTTTNRTDRYLGFGLNWL